MIKAREKGRRRLISAVQGGVVARAGLSPVAGWARSLPSSGEPRRGWSRSSEKKKLTCRPGLCRCR